MPFPVRRGTRLRPAGDPLKRNLGNPELYAAWRLVISLVLFCPPSRSLRLRGCPYRCGFFQRDPRDGGRCPGEMERLWKTLSGHHVEICDTYAVGDCRTPHFWGELYNNFLSPIIFLG